MLIERLKCRFLRKHDFGPWYGYKYDPGYAERFRFLAYRHCKLCGFEDSKSATNAISAKMLIKELTGDN